MMSLFMNPVERNDVVTRIASIIGKFCYGCGK